MVVILQPFFLNKFFMDNYFDVIILGGGPAGLTAGIYLSRAKIKTLILNEGSVGGQMVLTHEIANFPGVEKTSGFMLARTMKSQAQQFGCKIKSNVNITNINLNSKEKTIEINNKEVFTSKAVIIASGGTARTLDIKGENKFKGRGVSYCATCDGDFYQDMDIVVVGGGNSALEEAVALTKYAKTITVVHQFDHFQAFEHAVREAKANDKISFILESELIEIVGDKKVEKVIIEHQKTHEISELKTDGVFVFVGYKANSEKFIGKVETNKWGEIITNNLRETNVKGVFAAGDVIEKRVRQITTAVGDATIAAMSCINFLQENK